MYKDKSIKWLRQAIRQHRKVIEVFRYRYFWTDPAEYAQFREEILDKLIHQQKMMQEELDIKLGRV